jgi:hypothetical protein
VKYLQNLCALVWTCHQCHVSLVPAIWSLSDKIDKLPLFGKKKWRLLRTEEKNLRPVRFADLLWLKILFASLLWEKNTVGWLLIWLSAKKMKKQKVHLPPEINPSQIPKWLGNSSHANLPPRPPATPYNAFTKSNDPTLYRRYTRHSHQSPFPPKIPRHARRCTRQRPGLDTRALFRF